MEEIVSSSVPDSVRDCDFSSVPEIESVFSERESVRLIDTVGRYVSECESEEDIVSEFCDSDIVRLMDGVNR